MSRGSALVVAMLVTAILALLGISFLVLAETERRIAENEKRATQALYVAEAGLRAVKRWFDAPGSAMLVPPPSAVDRTLRRILDETDPNNTAAATAADGALGSHPYYKQAQDANGDGRDDLFERPYRGSDVDALLGTKDGPDLRIDDATTAGASFLDSLATQLLAGFPGEAGGVRARIRRIDVYAPPYELYGSVWQRAGIATVAVTATIIQDSVDGRQVLAERRLQAVLGEAPYRVLGLQGPLHSCAGIRFVPHTGGDLTVRWGPMMARTFVYVSGSPSPAPPIPRSLPRERPSRPGADALYPATPPGAFDTFLSTYVYAPSDHLIDDPWFRILSGGSISPPGTAPSDVAQDYSNLIPNLGVAVCPHYDYRLWKSIAQSGGPDVHYFVTAGGDSFQENGRLPTRSFHDITNGQTGVYFFDTTNRSEPEDTNADGIFDNLTDGFAVSGDWNFRGFIYLNSRWFQLQGVSGVATDLRPPGEPFLDEDDDGEYDAGEPFVNLDYATATATAGRVRTFGSESGPVRDARGPALSGDVSFRGVLYTSGSFRATGTGTVYGTVVANQGVTQSPSDGTADTPTLIWDASLAVDWPPADLPGVPRVVITEWDAGH